MPALIGIILAIVAIVWVVKGFIYVASQPVIFLSLGMLGAGCIALYGKHLLDIATAKRKEEVAHEVALVNAAEVWGTPPSVEQALTHLDYLYHYTCTERNITPLRTNALEAILPEFGRLYEKEFPPQPPAPSSKKLIDLQHTYNVFYDTCVQALVNLTQKIDREFVVEPTNALFTILYNTLNEHDVDLDKVPPCKWYSWKSLNMPVALHAMASAFDRTKLEAVGLFNWNEPMSPEDKAGPEPSPPWHATEMSEVNEYKRAKKEHEKRVEYERECEVIYQQPFRNTPLWDFTYSCIPLSTYVGLDIPHRTRFAHTTMLATTGAGKTQTLQHMLLHDFEEVKRGDASVILIDSQGEMIPRIAGLSLFAPGGELHGKLTLLEPSARHPLALNLFSSPIDPTMLDEEEQQEYFNTVVERVKYIFDTIFPAKLTGRQAVPFRYLTELMLTIPGAHLGTLQNVILDGIAKYRSYIDDLPSGTKRFFYEQFDPPKLSKSDRPLNPFEGARTELSWRVQAVESERNFASMFMQSQNKLDMFTEMNDARVILINTNQKFLREYSAPFGQYFLSLIKQATLSRGAPGVKKLPCFVYVDEFHEYCADDPNIVVMLKQARKYNVGLILATQEPQTLSMDVQRAVGQSATQMKGYTEQGNYDTAVWDITVQRIAQTPIQVRVPVGQMEALPRMSDDDYAKLKREMIDRYSVSPQHAPAAVQDNQPSSLPAPRTLQPQREEWGE